MNILITGGAGFIGTNLALHFGKTHHITIFDNLSRTGVVKNLKYLKAKLKNATYLIENIQNTEAVIDAVKDVDVVFHEAGQTAVTTSLLSPQDDFNTNAVGSLNLLEAVRLHNPKASLIFASTNKVYGDAANIQLQEALTRYKPVNIKAVSESQPLSFHSPYGCSKGAADQYMLDYARSYGLNTVVFRQSCIYGEHQLGVEDQGWVAHFANQVMNKQPITIYGNGKQVRDILFIQDLVLAYEQAIGEIHQIAGKAYNIGGGLENTISLIECIEKLNTLNNEKIKIQYQQARVGDQRYYVSEINKANNDFSWQPTTTVDQGLAKLIKWLKNN